MAARKGAGAKPKLTPDKQTFADLYRGGPEDVQGSAKACYARQHPRAKAKTCEVEGHRWLNDPAVQAYLEQKRRQAETRADITEARILDEMAAMAFFDIGRIFDDGGNILPLSEMDEQARRAVVSIETITQRAAGGSRDNPEYETVRKVRLGDKLRGLELLARNRGMLKDNVNVTNNPIAELLAKIDGSTKGLPGGGG